jgi:hypothetical protein
LRRRLRFDAAVPFSLAVLVSIAVGVAEGRAQGSGSGSRSIGSRPTRGVSATATIHWRDVPLQEAIARLEKLFGEPVFLDRRIDPTQHVALDIQATSIEQVLKAIAPAQKFDMSRIGATVYVGPRDSARRLRALSRTLADEARGLPDNQGAVLLRKRNVAWPRLTEPRGLVESIVKRAGWQVDGAERIPHDLWTAGELRGLTAVEQLTVLLAGFDLTFTLSPVGKTLEIVPLPESLEFAADDELGGEPPATNAPAGPANSKQVYSLRVVEKPVGSVVREVARRLNWQVEFDEAAIAAAGRSLEERVSMAVENVDQDKLLEALLTPAGLAFERDGERIKIVPGGEN